MSRIITALQVQVETSVYTDDKKLLSRPAPQTFVVFESEIPAAVMDWVREKLPKGDN